MQHRADIHWATVDHSIQQDWVDYLLALEQWLEQCIGAQGEAWEWFDNTGCQQVGFRRAEHLTLFLVAWTS